jgi:signal transduction histidine kinase
MAWSRRSPRLLAGISVALSAAILLSMSLLLMPGTYSADDYISAGVAMLVLTAVATVPFQPRHMLALGLAVEGMYILSSSLAHHWGIWSITGHREGHHVFILMVTLLSTGISAGNYRNRRSEHEARREAVRVAEALTGAQLRAQLAESAISIGKMAAALTHEINSPLGTLRSSVDTLVALTEKQLTATPERRAQLALTRAELMHSIQASSARIHEVVLRLRRFINLDEAELKRADINELLSDVVLLHEAEWKDRAELAFDLQPLPALTCRPQLLTAVFSNLLSNAVNAVGLGGKVEIATRKLETEIEVTIRDNGRGLSATQIDTIFDPRLKVSGNRVASANWSLFNNKQILYEHGGDIEVRSEEGRGTLVRVTLPA